MGKPAHFYYALYTEVNFMANAAEKVFGLIGDAVKSQGVSLWDVRLVKEGASWYLRIFIDKPEGISIDDCTNVSHAVEPIIDEADPIDMSYYLEVCSPGIERELTRLQHYTACVGEKVKIKLYRPVDGLREFTGVLESADGKAVINCGGKIYEFDFKDISKANLCDFE